MSETDEKIRRQIQAQLEIEKYKYRARLKVVGVQFLAALVFASVVGGVIWYLIPTYEDLGAGASQVAVSAAKSTVETVQDRVGNGINKADSSAEAEALASNLGAAFNTRANATLPPIQKQEYSSPPPAEMGQPFESERFSLALIGAQVARPKLTGMLGEPKDTEDHALILSLKIANNDDRKVLQFTGNRFSSDEFVLYDDVSNRIRRATFSLSSTLVGALTSSDDINPGESRSFVIAFDVPLPKTEYLTLTVDLSVFGDEGRAAFKVPVERIDGFQEYMNSVSDSN